MRAPPPGFVETRLAEISDANVVAYQAVPSSALQINERWDRFDQLKNELQRVLLQLEFLLYFYL